MSSKSIKLERIIKASPERIWRCWTVPKLFEQWYCPKPFKVELILQELHTGGRMHLKFGDENAFTKCGLILECIPNKKLVLTDAFTEAWIPSDRAFHIIEINIDDLGDGTVNYTIETKYWNIEDAEEQTKNGYLQGSIIVLNQLEELLEKGDFND